MSNTQIQTASPTALLLTVMLERHSDVTNTEIAEALKIKSSGNIITLFKKGRTKMPIKHVVPLCKFLEEDPTEMLESLLAENYSDVVEAMSHLKGKAFKSDEVFVIKYWRMAKELAKERLTGVRLAEHTMETSINSYSDTDKRNIKRVVPKFGLTGQELTHYLEKNFI